MTPSSTTHRQPAGTPTGGQFAVTARPENVTVLPDRAQTAIETMISLGALSPAARGMDPREAIDQWAEANGAPWEDRMLALRAAGMFPVLRADELQPGDLAQVDDLTGRDDVTLTLDVDDVTEVVIAETTATTGTTITFRLRDTDYSAQLGTLTIARHATLEVDPSPDRCTSCGLDAADADGLGGRCWECAASLDTEAA